MSDGLEPTTPAEAVEWYLAERDPELSEKSLQNHRYRLSQFLTFCEAEEIDNLNALTGRDLHRFRVWRSEDIKPVTLRGELQTLRVFLDFCAAIDAVEQGMRERVHLPAVPAEDEARDEHLELDRAGTILDHLDRFAYASREHVILAIVWHTGIRLGSLRALDVGDFDPDAQCLDIRHRPDTGTRLKNGAAAERSVAVGPYYCGVLQDYLEHNRVEVTDDHGRRPLLTSSHGRLSEGAVRETVYRVTQPCEIGECPHDRDPETCEARQHGKRAGCPSSRSPHGIRRGSITDHLRNGTPQEVVSDRSDVSADVLDQHYDERTEREKMQIRRDFIEDA
ncbi:tyrosine-type recombinase/integrase [Halomarina halobia]|uniref:Tyrosine-type recombinase/integrase n=1 Tax=Halomarina halobia TaxID=3033386 RepID=A0ABD6A6S1_9EURY|nr:tyrosine-type recombinase/integrase [Halomarina sp. PSR21]